MIVDYLKLNLDHNQKELVETVIYHLFPLFLILITHIGIKNKKEPQGSDKFSYVWFIFNGAIIHIFLDGIIGGLRFCKPLFNVYSYLDQRYLHSIDIVYIVCIMEIVFMGPVSLYVGRLMLQESTVKREILRIILSTVQLFGTIIFVGHEILRNMVDVCGLKSCLTLNMHNIIFFYLIFVFANIVWIVLPLQEIEYAYQNLKILKGDSQNNNKLKSE